MTEYEGKYEWDEAAYWKQRAEEVDWPSDDGEGQYIAQQLYEVEQRRRSANLGQDYVDWEREQEEGGSLSLGTILLVILILVIFAALAAAGGYMSHGATF